MFFHTIITNKAYILDFPFFPRCVMCGYESEYWSEDCLWVMFLSCRRDELCLCQCFLCLSTGADVWASTMALWTENTAWCREVALSETWPHISMHTRWLRQVYLKLLDIWYSRGTVMPVGWSRLKHLNTHELACHEMLIHTFMLPQTVTPNDVGDLVFL